MASEDLQPLIQRLHQLRATPPDAAVLRGQVNDLATQVAQATGASVRVVSEGGLQVRFAGRNAALAATQFARMAESQATSWAEQVAAIVVGRLS